MSVLAAGIPEIPLWMLVLGLEFPAVTALLDCWFRSPDDFAEGEDDQRAWRNWLIVAVITVPILFGYLILIGYYHSVVRRTSMR